MLDGRVDIGETAKKYISIVPNLMSAHALTGCDTVGGYYGIGKTKAVKVLELTSVVQYW